MIDPSVVDALKSILLILEPLPLKSRDWILSALGSSVAHSGGSPPRRKSAHEPSANHGATQAQNGASAEAQNSLRGSGFLSFWRLYPKKRDRIDAEKIWIKLKPDPVLESNILEALKLQLTCEQWTRDNGQYIPYPKTWLNRRSWEDEPDALLAQTVAQNGALKAHEPGAILTQKTRGNVQAARSFVARAHRDG